MTEEEKMPALDGWGEKWQAGPLLNFCIRNKLVPPDSEQPVQASLIDSVNLPCILLGDCPALAAI